MLALFRAAAFLHSVFPHFLSLKWAKLAGQVKRIKAASVSVDQPDGKALATSLGIMTEGIPNLKLVLVNGDDIKSSSITLVKGDTPSARQLRQKLKPLMKELQKDADGKFLKAEPGSAAAQKTEAVNAEAAAKTSQSEKGVEAQTGGTENSEHIGTAVTDDNFDSTVAKSPVVWAIEFMSAKCGSCKEFAPTWKETASGLKRLEIGSVDIDDPKAAALAQRLGVLDEGIPCVKLFRDGRSGAGANHVAIMGATKLMNVKQLRFALKKGLAGLSKDASGKFLKEGAALSDNAPQVTTGGSPKKVSRSNTLELTDADFHAKIKAEGAMLVEFYAPWCGNCKRLAPIWKKLGAKLNADMTFPVTVAAVDAVANTKLASEYSISSYPTIKMVGYSALGSKHSVDFKLQSMKGGQEIENLTDFARNNADVKAAETQAQAAARAKEEAEKLAASKQEAEAAAQPDDAPVRIVTDKTWKAEQNKAMKNSGQFFVKFYAPWCGHCKALAPKWEQAAGQLKARSDITFANVDCTIQKQTCKDEGIESYPFLIKFNSANMKGEWPGEQYEKEHEIDALVAFAKAGTKDEL